MLGLRVGLARAIVTTTPKPVQVLRDLVKSATTSVTRGDTFENIDNLSPVFREQILSRYEGTRIGRQEIYAEILDDVEGALWTQALIDANRSEAPDMTRIVVAVDPAITSTASSSEVGIIVGGVGTDGLGYVLDDLSTRDTPEGWARIVYGAYRKWKADRVVAEVNQGGDMVEAVLRTVSLDMSYKAVHASRGKITRAEPIASLYEQGRIKHVGKFEQLETQMCTYVPGEPSPDRMDALVWAFTELNITQPSEPSVMSSSSFSPYADGY